MSIDVERLLTALSPDDPCGPDLEYDRAFGELDRAAQGKAEQQIGDTVTPAEPPDWKAVEKQAVALFERTKDLRVACLLAKALLRNGGLAGFGDGLAVVRGLCERHWDTVHPRLDPDDGNDPTIRVNTLLGLCDTATLNAVRTAPLVISRAVGKFSLRDLAIATGEAQPADGEAKTEMSNIEAAFSDIDMPTLEGTATAVRRALENSRGIEISVTERTEIFGGINLTKLSGLLKTADDLVSAQAARRAGAVDEGNGAAAAAPTAATGGAEARGPALTGEIRSREDVLRALDKICAYYERHEPASPVPLFMRRCKRLVTMNFMDIVKDMAPDALSHVQMLTGSAGDEEAT